MRLSRMDSLTVHSMKLQKEVIWADCESALGNHVGVEGLDKATGSTALYWPCYGGHRGIVEVLLTQPDFGRNRQSKQAGRSSSACSCLEGFCRLGPLPTGKGSRTDLNTDKKLASDVASSAACKSLMKKNQGADGVRTLSKCYLPHHHHPAAT